MENKNVGLKFRILSDGEIFVDNDNNTTVDCFSELTKEERMLYNFEQMERFCGLGKDHYINKDESDFFKYYIVLKDFRDVVINGEITEEYKIFQEGKLNAICESPIVYFNGKYLQSNGYVSIVLENPLHDPLFKHIYQNVDCYISVIDNQGNERLTQTTVFLYPDKFLRNEAMKFDDFISLETMLCNSPELLHYDDLVLCVKLEFNKYSDAEIEEKIVCFFANVVPYSTEIGEKTNDLFEECLHFDEDFLFDSDIGKILCNNSFFFKSRLNYSQFQTERQSVLIPYKEREHLINICRILIGDYIIVKHTTEEICELYRVADQYGISRVMEFCVRILLKQDFWLSVNHRNLLCEIAETCKDIELKTIVDGHLRGIEKFICESSDLEHLHDNVFPGYLECDTSIELNEEYYGSDFNYEEIDCKFNFSSIFNKTESEELTLSLKSDFGKLLCKNSDILKRQIEHSSSETKKQAIQIIKKDIEPFKNIYRLLMGGHCIKASTIFDIICLYELGDSYGISFLMETCRNLFQRYICRKNVETIRKLAEMHPDDFELKKIVESFQTECERYESMQLDRFTTTRYFGPKNSEFPNEEYDFYK